MRRGSGHVTLTYAWNKTAKSAKFYHRNNYLSYNIIVLLSVKYWMMYVRKAEFVHA